MASSKQWKGGTTRRRWTSPYLRTACAATIYIVHCKVQLPYILKIDLQWSNQQCTNAYLYQYPTGGWDQLCYKSQRSWPLLTSRSSRRKVGRESAKLTAENTRRWIQLKVLKVFSASTFSESWIFHPSISVMRLILSFHKVHFCWFDKCSGFQGWGWGLAFFRRALRARFARWWRK